jgi:hypothetical protein
MANIINIKFSLHFQLVINCPDITHGEVIADRKSIFQGHAAQVQSVDDIQ